MSGDRPPLGFLPTGIGSATSPVVGSMRSSSPVRSLATQMDPSPMASAFAPEPTGIVSSIAFRPGSILVTLPSKLLVTQTAASPIAIPVGTPPAPIVLTTAFRAGSIRETVRSSKAATQISDGPMAIASGRAPTGSVERKAPSPGRARTRSRSRSSWEQRPCRRPRCRLGSRAGRSPPQSPRPRSPPTRAGVEGGARTAGPVRSARGARSSASRSRCPPPCVRPRRGRGSRGSGRRGPWRAPCSITASSAGGRSGRRLDAAAARPGDGPR